jgi:anti-anti-sigma factor
LTADMGNELMIQANQTPGNQVIHAAGALSAATAGDMKDVLLAALEAGGPTVLDISGITEIDLPGLQLLCSAHQTFKRQDTVFRIEGRTEAVRSTACDAGYQMRSSVCPYRQGEECPWR